MLFALPFAIPAALVAWVPIAAVLTLVLGAAGANWWLALTDWKTFAIAAGALTIALSIATSGKPWARLAMVALLAATGYLKGHVDGAAQKDQWWRTRIAASSAKVKEVIDKGTAEAIATDDDVIEAIRDTHAKLADAERKLKDAAAAAGKPPAGAPGDKLVDKAGKVDSQCLLPAHCLGGGGLGALSVR